MKYLMLWGLLAGAAALVLLAWNTVINMRFAKYEPGWTTRETWWLDRLMLGAAVLGLAGLAAVLASMPLAETSVASQGEGLRVNGPSGPGVFGEALEQPGLDGVTAPGAEGLEGDRGVKP